MGSLILSSGFWCAQDFVCALQDRSLIPPVLWKSNNQIPLGFKVRFPGDSQSLYWVLSLGSLTWGSEPSQQRQNFFGIIVLQFVDHPPIRYAIWFYCDCAPPTILLWLLLCLWTWGIISGGFQCPPVNGFSTASCNFGALGGGDEHTSFYSTILNWKSQVIPCKALKTVPIDK